MIVEAPAIPFHKRRFDDPYMRIQAQAEERARRNGAVEAEIHAAGRKAMALRKLTLALSLEPNAETILRTVAGEYRPIRSSQGGREGDEGEGQQ